MTLDGSASSDPDSTPGTNDDIVFFEWYEHFGTPSKIFLGKGVTPNVPVFCGKLSTRISGVRRLRLGQGKHLITLKVTDKSGTAGTDSVTVNIVAPKEQSNRGTRARAASGR